MRYILDSSSETWFENGRVENDSKMDPECFNVESTKLICDSH